MVVTPKLRKPPARQKMISPRDAWDAWDDVRSNRKSRDQKCQAKEDVGGKASGVKVCPFDVRCAACGRPWPPDLEPHKHRETGVILQTETSRGAIRHICSEPCIPRDL